MKSGEINSLFKNLSKVIKNPRSDLKYKNPLSVLMLMLITSPKIYIQNIINLNILLSWEGKR